MRDHENAAFTIPAHLRNRPIPRSNDNSLKLLSDRYPEVQMFCDITTPMLSALYADPNAREIFWRVLRQLRFFGAVFRRPLLATPTTDFVSTQYLWIESGRRPQPLVWETAPSAIRIPLREYGLVYKGDAVGVSLEAMQSLMPEFPMVMWLREQGYHLVNIAEYRLREGLDEGGMESGAEELIEVRFRLLGEEFVFPASIARQQISPKTLPHSLAVVRTLIRSGYRRLGDLPPDLDNLVLNVKGVGYGRARKFIEDLQNLALETSPGVQTGTAGSEDWNRIFRVASEVPISPDSFPQLDEVVRALTDRGMRRVGSLPRVQHLRLYLASLPGVGSRSAEQFVRTLAGHAGLLERTGNGVQSPEAKIIWIAGQFLILYRPFLHLPLTDLVAVLPRTASVVKELAKAGVSTPAELPTCLSDLQARVPGISGRDQKALWTALQMLVSDGQSSQPLDLHTLYRDALDLANGQRPDRVSPRDWEMFQYRLDQLEAGKKPTLQHMGEVAVVSRERARQIYRKLGDLLVAPHVRTIAFLRRALQEQGQFADLDAFTSEPFLTGRARWALGELLAARGIIYDPNHGYVTSLSEDAAEKVLTDLKGWLHDRLGGRTLSDPDLGAEIKRFVEERGLAQSATRPLTSVACQRYLTRVAGDAWSLPLTKAALALRVFRDVASERTAGVALHRDIDILLSRAEELVPGAFDNGRSLEAALLRNASEVILWGWGLYITRDQVPVRAGDLEPVAAWIEKQFGRGTPQLSSRAAFHRFRASLESLGVPNDYALYSCLRLFHGTRFFLPKCPKIFPRGQQELLTNGELVLEFLTQRGNATLSDLRQEFVERRGWQPFQLDQALVNSDQIIRTGKGSFGLLGGFPVNPEELEALAAYFESRFSADVPSLSIRLLFQEREATCLSLGIPNEYVLYDVMSAYNADRLTFSRFPHVTLGGASTSVEKTNMGYLEEFLRSVGTPMLKEELREEFVNRRGWTQRALDNALRQPNILPLQLGVVSEYVHRDVIGWSDEKQEQLEDRIRSAASEVNNRRFPFSHLRELLHSTPLPKLAGRVLWTQDLLRFFLADMDFVLLLGTKSAVFTAYPNTAGVEDDHDFIAYVLRTDFGGAAKIQAMEKRLAELDFRVKELSQPGEAVAGDLHYYYVGDEILLKELG